MHTLPPRPLRAALACLLLAGALPLADAAAPPTDHRRAQAFEGTWKVILTQQNIDITFWLVKIDPKAKKVEIVSSVNPAAKASIANPAVNANLVSYLLTAGPRQFRFALQPPRDPNGQLMKGTMQEGATLRPIWLEKTTLTELTKDNAARQTPGFAEVMAALQQTDPKERIKGLRAAATKHAGHPVHFLALQALMSEYLKQKADTAAIRALAEEYRRVAREYGDAFLVGANLDIARNLMDHPTALPVAVESAREAVDALRPEHHMAMRMSAYLTLAAGLHKAGKGDPIKVLTQELARLSEQSLQQVKGKGQAEIATLQQLAVMMLSSPSPEVAELGLTYARRAAKLLKDDMPVQLRAGTYHLLHRALEARGKADEAKEVAAKVEKLDAELDRAYLKQSVPFAVEPYKGRKGASDRVALVELFTDSAFTQTVAANIAFDAALQRYTPKEAVFIQYHLAHPNPSVLVNRDTEKRKAFYSSDLEGLPAMFVDGKLTPALDGGSQRGREKFGVVKDAIDQALESPPMARLKLEVARKGDLVTATANVSGLKETGAKVRLRFALVEQRVRYTAGNGVRLHHHVLRAFLGGDGGFKLEKPEVTQSASVSLPQLRKQLAEAMEEGAKKVNLPWPERPLALARLKVVAWVQDEDSKQVYNAAQADVPAK